MLWVCGNDRDYDNWAAQGNPGWEYKNILPLIRDLEKNTDDNITDKYPNFHGKSGKVVVSTPQLDEPYENIIKSAFTEKGYKILDDFNSGQNVGVGRVQLTVDNGNRCSAARAFLRTCKYCMKQPNQNLYLLKNSMATQITFANKTATGVKVMTKEDKCTQLYFKARKEIVVSAGAYNTPKLLLQSGIGRKDDLEKFNITQVADLPVGENLQDHVHALNFIKVSPISGEYDGLTMFLDTLQYMATREGYLSHKGLLSVGGFINTESINATYPDIQYIFYNFLKSDDSFLHFLNTLRMKDVYKEKAILANQDYEILVALTYLKHPKSRGTVKLSSADPTVQPKIIENHLSHPDDVRTVSNGVKFVHEILETEQFRKNNASFIDFNIAECGPSGNWSSKYIECYLKYFSETGWHIAGTAKMGRKCSNHSVVDEKLRIHGLANIRVADASIMPDVVSGNTQCPVYAIGMKASRMILADMNKTNIFGGSHHHCHSKPGDDKKCEDKITISTSTCKPTDTINSTTSKPSTQTPSTKPTTPHHCDDNKNHEENSNDEKICSTTSKPSKPSHQKNKPSKSIKPKTKHHEKRHKKLHHKRHGHKKRHHKGYKKGKHHRGYRYKHRHDRHYYEDENISSDSHENQPHHKHHHRHHHHHDEDIDDENNQTSHEDIPEYVEYEIDDEEAQDDEKCLDE